MDGGVIKLVATSLRPMRTSEPLGTSQVKPVNGHEPVQATPV
jgi:hypothetical protein